MELQETSILPINLFHPARKPGQKKWSQLWESNPRPADYKSTALAN